MVFHTQGNNIELLCSWFFSYRFDRECAFSSKSNERKDWTLSNAYSQMFLVMSGSTICPRSGKDSKGEDTTLEAMRNRGNEHLICIYEAQEGQENQGFWRPKS